MKKLFCAALLLTASVASFAQDGVDRKPADDQKLEELITSTLEMIEPTLTSPDTKKQLANAWDVKANLKLFQINGYVTQLQAGQQIDVQVFHDIIIDAVSAMEECYKVELNNGTIAEWLRELEKVDK